jgi:hypothetical protein
MQRAKKKPTGSTRRPAAATRDGDQPKQRKNHHGLVQWKAFLYEELRALQFHTAEHFAAAADLLWTGELRDMPCDLVGNRTIIIPAEAVAFFAALDATATDVLSPGDLSPQERASLRAELGPY